MRLIYLLILLAQFLPEAAAAEFNARHAVNATLSPETSSIRVKDRIELAGRVPDRLGLALAPGAKIESLRLDGNTPAFTRRGPELRIGLAPGARARLIEIDYSARFSDPLPGDVASFDNPGLGVTGTITGDAAFLLPGTLWVPRVQGAAESHTLVVDAPEGMVAATQGAFLGREDAAGRTVSRWEIKRPIEGLALSVGRYAIDEKKAAGTTIQTFFLPETRKLAARYLDASAKHLEFFVERFGPYPFEKFAVVENVFATGYGFPSYTLLGTQVLNLPFIPETSLKHEIAHCWWGNGVLVDISGGNWCEGLTTYVADYLALELDSPEKALDYRLTVLRDYALLAANGREKPLKDFIGRDSPASQTLGYGKAMFVFHMLRKIVGEKAFWGTLKRIAAERMFTEISWEDIRKYYVGSPGFSEAVSKRFFEAWIGRPGAVELAPPSPYCRVESGPDGKSGMTLHTAIRRAESLRAPFALPWRIETGAGAHNGTVFVDAASLQFVEPVDAAPLRFALDPDADVFRRLPPAEIPAVVNTIKGADSAAFLISRVEGDLGERLAGRIAAGLNQPKARIVREEEMNGVLARLLAASNVVFIGVPESEAGLSLFPKMEGPMRFLSSGPEFPVGPEYDMLFAVFKRGTDPKNFTAVLGKRPDADPAMVESAVRRLTHYGKSSWVTFKGGKNTGRGTVPPKESALSVSVGPCIKPR